MPSSGRAKCPPAADHCCSNVDKEQARFQVEKKRGREEEKNRKTQVFVRKKKKIAGRRAYAVFILFEKEEKKTARLKCLCARRRKRLQDFVPMLFSV
eukprot:g61032.t1